MLINEVVLIVWCDPNGCNVKVHNRIPYLSLIRPKFEVLQQALRNLGIEEVGADHCKQLVGIGTGVASAIITKGLKLKGITESKLEWIVWMLSLAHMHRFELAIKDALINTYLDGIDDMLLIFMKNLPKCAVN